MAKKTKNKSIQLFLTIGVIALVVLGLIWFLFLDSIVQSGDLEEPVTFNGLRVIFGYTIKESGEFFGQTITSEFKVLGFSFPAFLVVILAIAGVLLVALNKKLLVLIGGIVLLVACVMSFFTPAYAMFDEGTLNIYKALEYNAGVGAILGGIFFGLGGLAGLSKLVLAK